LIKNRAFFFTRLYSNETICFLNVLAEANVVFDLKSKNTLYVTKKEVYFSSCFTNFFGGKNKRESTVFDKERLGRGGAASRHPSRHPRSFFSLSLQKTKGYQHREENWFQLKNRKCCDV